MERTEEQILHGLNVQLRILRAGLREGAKDPDLPHLIAEKEAEIAALTHAEDCDPATRQGTPECDGPCCECDPCAFHTGRSPAIPDVR